MFEHSVPHGPAPAAENPRWHRSGAPSGNRRRLERAGWRTTLDFKENHVRSTEGRLVRIDQIWVAEAEHVAAGGVDVVCASARTAARAWSKVAAAALDGDSGEGSRAHELGVRARHPIS